MGAFSCLSALDWTEFTKALSPKDKENLSLFEHLSQEYNIFCHHIRIATMRYNGKAERSKRTDICCANPLPFLARPALLLYFCGMTPVQGFFVIFGGISLLCEQL